VPLLLTGTMGAFIRIREPIPSKRMLFDIGIAGPIAGFVVAVPALFIGSRCRTWSACRRLAGSSSASRCCSSARRGCLGHAAGRLLAQHAPDGVRGVVRTAGDGAQPVSDRQLDGGHISYSVLGPRWSTVVTFATVAVAAGLAFFASTWVVWIVLMIAMLIVFGPRHPRVFDEHVPLDRTRLWLALFALVMFILCFTPAPIRPMEIIAR
jgi:hypothetical protein